MAKPDKQRIGPRIAFVFLLILFLSMGLLLEKAYRKARQPEWNRALLVAIQQNDTPAVTSLLSEGADANADDPPPDRRLIWQRLWDRLRGKPLPPTGRPVALFWAVKVGSEHGAPPDNAAMVRALLDAGSTVNVADEYGIAPLMWAVVLKKRETVRMLLERKARVNLGDIQGNTPLHYAAETSDPSIVQSLLAGGADVNARTLNGKTPLHTAAFWGPPETIRLLLAHGSRVNVRDSDGQTPLSEAVRGQNESCVKLLLANGAQVATRDSEGDTPLASAQFYRETAIVNMLRKAGAR